MSGADDRNQSTRESEAVLISVGELIIKYDLCTLVQIGGLFQSYKLRGISRYVSRYGPPYRGIPRYGNSSRYPPLLNTRFRWSICSSKFLENIMTSST